jgi:hypothetical protein
VDLIVVWRLDRAFRSVLDGATTLGHLRAWGWGLRSLQEPWIDTPTPIGEAMFHITIAWAGLEKRTLSERTRAVCADPWEWYAAGLITNPNLVLFGNVQVKVGDLLDPLRAHGGGAGRCRRPGGARHRAGPGGSTGFATGPHLHFPGRSGVSGGDLLARSAAIGLGRSGRSWSAGGLSLRNRRFRRCEGRHGALSVTPTGCQSTTSPLQEKD